MLQLNDSDTSLAATLSPEGVGVVEVQLSPERGTFGTASNYSVQSLRSLTVQNPTHQARIKEYFIFRNASSVEDCVHWDKKLFAFLSDSAILQAPPSVHEGDLLILRFRTRPEYDASITTVYFQNKAVMQSLGSHPQFNLGRAQTSMSGSYKCQTNLYEKAEGMANNYISDDLYLSVTELFSIPQIKVSPDQVTEGDHMTITCDTNLSPHRETTELQLAFYRNGHNVQGFSLSNQYGVPSAQLEDSGNYTCEVQTPTGSVRKMSSIWDFQLQGEIVELETSNYPFLWLKVSVITINGQQ
ncbi:Fc receptor-like protein 5 [Xenopus laevis]|uniref:Fc receptor-like protein 5 n=1 Tax=Xenopus laevis TaxID=8355 RepID=A0A8J1LK87_XENLA|nr:Fc receptor-like protein 5 [Xenopus laevis]